MPTSAATLARRRTGVETYHIERTVLEPIAIEDPERELIQISDAAELLGVRMATVIGYLDRGGLSAVRRSGAGRRWLLRSEVEGLAERRRSKRGSTHNGPP